MNKTRKQKTKVRQHTEHGPRDCQKKTGNTETHELAQEERQKRERDMTGWRDETSWVK